MRNEGVQISWINRHAAKSTNKQPSSVNPGPLKKRRQDKIKGARILLRKWERAGKSLENHQTVMQVCFLRKGERKEGWMEVSKAVQGYLSQNQPTQESHVSQDWACLSFLAALSHCLGAACGQDGYHESAAMIFRVQRLRSLANHATCSERSARHILMATTPSILCTSFCTSCYIR